VTVDVSVIMPVCAWPAPDDMSGLPHPQLGAALASVAAATTSNIELIVGVDGHATAVLDAVRGWEAPKNVAVHVHAFEKQKAVTFGNYQRNQVLERRLATGRLICWQDQDDQFFPGALGHVIALANEHPGRPLIFKMQVCSDSFHSPPFVLWRERGRIERNHIGGHMLVVPNEPELLGRWVPETSYAADFDFIEETLRRFAVAGREPVWSETYISNLRPHTMGGR
jgi:glycosyltransferase involved in cell wall biosynthesis